MMLCYDCPTIYQDHRIGIYCILQILVKKNASCLLFSALHNSRVESVGIYNVYIFVQFIFTIGWTFFRLDLLHARAGGRFIACCHCSSFRNDASSPVFLALCSHTTTPLHLFNAPGRLFCLSFLPLRRLTLLALIFAPSDI